MNVRAAEKICEVLGRVISSTNPNGSEGGSFIRIRVSMNISIPLCRGRLVTMGSEEQI